MRKRPCTRTGFSLVEVTIAIGIAAFCLITVYGLLPVGLKSNQDAIQQTLANSILSVVSADLKNTPPTTLGDATTPSPQFLIPLPTGPVTTAPAATTLYFTEDGQVITQQQKARFRVTVTFLINGTEAPSTTMAYVKISWPPAAPLDKALGSVQTFLAWDRN